MKTILVLTPIQEKHIPILKEAGKGCNFEFCSAGEVSQEAVDRADIILGNPNPEMLHARPTLEYLALESAGSDAYIVPGLLDKRTVITNASGAYSKTVAEHALAMTLMLQKNIHLFRDSQNKGIWKYEGQTSSMSDAVVLIAGLGEIGSYYARQAKALGAYVIGLKRRMSDKPDYADELYTSSALSSHIGKADVVVNFLPATKETYHIFNSDMFNLMKPGSIYINCGRGSTQDLAALCDALTENRLRAAGCDVFETEPLPPDSPAWNIPSLMITPHRAGNYMLPSTIDEVVDITARNLKAWLTGGKLLNIVDFKAGY